MNTQKPNESGSNKQERNSKFGNFIKSKKNLYIVGGIVAILIIAAIVAFFMISPEEEPVEDQDIIEDEKQEETEKLEITTPETKQIEADLFIVSDEVTITRDTQEVNYTGENVTVYEGDVIKTSETGAGYVVFADNSMLAIDKNSEIELDTYQQAEAGGYKVNIKQTFGSIWSRVEKLIGNDSEYTIETSNTLASVRGTEFGCQAQPGNTTCFTDAGEILLKLKNVRDELSEFLLEAGKEFENDDEKMKAVEKLQDLTQFVSDYKPLDTDWQDFIDCIKPVDDPEEYQECGEPLLKAIEAEIEKLEEETQGTPTSGGAPSPACGDNVPDPGEVCDDGNNVSGDGCSADCSSNETCGNEIVDSALGEECDPPQTGSCDDDCQNILTTTCSNPTDPTNGSYSSCANTADGDTCTLTCDIGYQKAGDALCDNSGWTYPSDPQCEPICDNPSCISNASCVAPQDCQCDDGYTGDGEESCDPECNPRCATTAICIAPNDCQCPSGYSGDPYELCEPECSQECGINAECTAPDTCECISGLTGDPYVLCEADCLNPTCGINAICVAPEVCECPPGSAGDPFVECIPACEAPCAENATCVGPEDCQCNSGYIGNGHLNCTPTCYNPACGIDAICTAPEVCECPTGSTGDPYVSCSSQCSLPCAEFATCIAPETCACDPGFIGDPYQLCEPLCDEPPCVENATCVDPQYCMCDPGYMGDGFTFCESECFDPPCGQNAICVGPDVCECEPGYIGDPYGICDPASPQIDTLIPRFVNTVQESMIARVVLIMLTGGLTLAVALLVCKNSS